MTTRAYERWVPKAAQETLNELFAQHGLTPRYREILDRLADNPVMADAWQKLPRDPPNLEGLVIRWAFGAAIAFRPPMPKKKSEMVEWLRAYPPVPSAEGIAYQASCLKESMAATAPDAADSWHHLWPGDATISINRAIAIVGEIEEFYWRLDAQHQATIKTLNLPDLRKKRGKSAPQVYFSKVMSDRLAAVYGRPLDAIVTALTEAVFNLRSGIDEATIRGRRRKVRPEHSHKKSA